MGPYVTPTPLPAGWEATAYPGAQPVIVEQFSPTALNTVQIAQLGVELFGFALVVILLLLLVFTLRRA